MGEPADMMVKGKERREKQRIENQKVENQKVEKQEVEKQKVEQQIIEKRIIGKSRPRDHDSVAEEIQKLQETRGQRRKRYPGLNVEWIVICMVSGIIVLAGLGIIGWYNKRIMEQRKEYQRYIMGVVSQRAPLSATEILNDMMRTPDQEMVQAGKDFLTRSSYKKTSEIFYRQMLLREGLILCGFMGLIYIGMLYIFFIVKENLHKKARILGYQLDHLEEGEVNLAWHYTGTVGKLQCKVQDAAERMLWQITSLQMEKRKMGEFIENISHQLKTPIATCQLYLENLERKETDEKRCKKFEECQKQLNSVTDIIQQLLKSGKLDSGTMIYKFEEHSLKQTMKQVWERVEGLAFQKGIAVSYKENKPITFLYDKLWMGEALENVMKNCIQYALPGTQLEVESVLSDKSLSITISDTGIHIDEQDAERLFDRFYFGTVNNAYKNTGVGLHLAKSVIVGHYGKIWVENHGEGVCFTIKLPILSGREVYEM